MRHGQERRGHPSLGIGPRLETERHDIGDILRESLAHERKSLLAYQRLPSLVKDQNVRLEELAREMIAAEVAHQDEVDEMLPKQGQTGVFAG